MKIKITYFIVMVSAFFISCKSNGHELEPYELCSEFYELNNGMDFDELLFRVHVLGIREYSVYDDNIHRYNRIPVAIGLYDSISNKYLLLPSFSKNAHFEEQKLFYARCDTSSILYLKSKYKVNNDNDLFESYVKEIKSIYSKYYQIKVPDVLPYLNVEINGCNNYIEFILYKNDEKKIKYCCYYAKDSIFPNNRLKDYFNNLSKFDDHWYYKL